MDRNLSFRTLNHYFRHALLFTGLGLVLGFALGWQGTGTLKGAATVCFVVAVLAALEISLSFDNAIVNANKLRDMRPEWQRRFLTWGIVIAVFGMRIVFPLLIVVVAAGIGPVDAVLLSTTDPDAYAQIMHDAHVPIAAFGGTFLLMVSLAFFFDPKKDIHWLPRLEEKIADIADIRGIEVMATLSVVMLFSRLLDDGLRPGFLEAAIWGLVAFLVVDVLGNALDRAAEALDTAARGGLGAFLYLEVLDASFSFDGVIGAFALSKHLFVIAIGLGIGAMFVRSMTIMLVEHETLKQYRFLEHGAFYAILFLSIIMLLQTWIEIPETVTGLSGVTVIGVALWASIRFERKTGRARLPEPGSDTG